MLDIKGFYHTDTCTNTYLVTDSSTGDCILIDPVLDFDSNSMTVWSDSIDHILSSIRSNKLNLHAVLETHVHADHFSAANYVQSKIPGVSVAISQAITEVAQTMVDVLKLDHQYQDVKKYFDILLTNGQQLNFGGISLSAHATPGHTPACMSFLVGDCQALFTGDTMFMPDCGTGRCDFPGGSGELLFKSIKEQIYSLPDQTILHPGHDYPNGKGRAWCCTTTVAEQKRHNIQLSESVLKDEFIEFRTQRDKQLSLPKLIVPALQVNLLGGKLPSPSDLGPTLLKMPLKVMESKL